MKNNESKKLGFFAAIAMLIIALFFFVFPVAMFTNLLIIFNLGLIILGTANIVSYFVFKTYSFRSSWLIIEGFFNIMVGVIMMLNPAFNLLYAGIIIGMWALFSSINKISVSLEAKKADYSNWWLILLSGAIGVVISLFLLSTPIAGTKIASRLIGFYFLAASLMSLINWETN